MIKFMLVLVVVCAIGGIAIAWPLISCAIKEADYGTNTKWSLFNGCLVETKPGIFVPADRYRGEAGG